MGADRFPEKVIGQVEGSEEVKNGAGTSLYHFPQQFSSKFSIACPQSYAPFSLCSLQRNITRHTKNIRSGFKIFDKILSQIFNLYPQYHSFMILALSKGEEFSWNGQWTEQTTAHMKTITDLTVKRLHLWNNKRATLVKEISHIDFPALTTLHLEGNNILSVERLPNMHMPQIQILSLYNNTITSVRVMRKARWRKLEKLFLNNNPFKDANYLAESCFPLIDNLQIYEGLPDTTLFTQRCFPSKLQTHSLQCLYINSIQFSFHRSVQGVFMARWPNIDIY